MEGEIKRIEIAVIGAGIIGFSSATCIQENIQNCNVTIIAEDVNPDITSEAAAGLIELHCIEGNSKETLQRWLVKTLQRVSEIFYRSEDVKNSGISATSGYFLSKTMDIEKLLQMEGLEMLPHWHKLTSEELKSFPDYKSGIFACSFTAEGALYVPWMKNQFEKNGGQFIKKKVCNIEEIVHDYDAVINCSAMGARDLVKDDAMIPIKGHVLKVQAPWVKHFLFIADDGDTYIIPGTSGVSLGGIHQWNNWDETIDKNDSKAILERCCALLPSLKKAEIIREVIGWRPHRPQGVRVETEMISCDGNSILCVHNYGHAGAGVSLSWGCALDVTNLLKNYLFKKNKSKL